MEDNICSLCNNTVSNKILISLDIDIEKICFHCYFNIKYSNNENFDNLINNDIITIYDYVKKFKNIHDYENCLIEKCLLCDIKNGKIIRNLKDGEKIYGNSYIYIEDENFLYNETIKLEKLLYKKLKI